MNNVTPTTYLCTCRACPRLFPSRYIGAPYCERCLIDRVLVTTHIPVSEWRGGAAVPLGESPASVMTPEAPASAGEDSEGADRWGIPPTSLAAYRACVQYHAVQAETEAFQAECAQARRARRRGLRGAAASAFAVAGVALFWMLLAAALSAWKGY